MKIFANKLYFRFLIVFFAFTFFLNIQATEGLKSYTISNKKIKFTLFTGNGKISREVYSLTNVFAEKENGNVTAVWNDGNFLLDIFWTYWNAPGKINNSDVQLHLDKNNFEISNVTVDNNSPIEKIVVNLVSKQYGFKLRIIYSIKEDAFFVKKQITISENVYQNHFLQKVHTFHSKFQGIEKVIKEGGYGQPIAFETKKGGGFIAVEYPTATNRISNENIFFVSTTEILGKKITAKGIEASKTVIALTPRKNVRFMFTKYLDDIRIAKLRPYTLYNSWYDLRSVEFPDVPEKFQMNEKNVFRIINEIKHNFVEKHKIKIDAVVLDDGWDVYESDWQLRKNQFPNGLKPISDSLKAMNSVLGIWFGPTGGYSFRMRRIKWMKNHGYEVTGSLDNDWQAMLCIGGKNYKSLFKKRVVDFIGNANVGYYKWDGIQFSCSEKNHGHPIGEYSRRAIMESVAEICNAVRSANKDIFLNITSGTWLSPWWLKYANTIWMQGGDYGYSDVPSISSRDRAITYRDITLYNDLVKNNLWFPVANLMTHGIIKGELQKLGGESEPIDKFADNAILYFARGVTMYELYISPDILSDAEWNALASSLKWGKENFNILKTTEMIGGNPSKGETYGYSHFSNDEAIIAVRNPKIENDKIEFVLDTNFGFGNNLHNLIMEEVYPQNTVHNKTYNSGDKITVALSGFETKIFHFYPETKAKKPLISGIDYINTGNATYILAPTGDEIQNITSELSRSSIDVNGNKLSIEELIEKLSEIKSPKVSDVSVNEIGRRKIKLIPKLNKNTVRAEISILFENQNGEDNSVLPSIKFTVDSSETESKSVTEKGKWCWTTISLPGKAKSVVINFPGKNVVGKVSIYLITYENREGLKVKFANEISEILPPRPLENGLIKRTKKVSELKINL